jgi:nicotinamidase-related amidase
MDAPQSLPRSPELMNRDDAALLVVDMQVRLLPLIPRHRRLVWNVRRLLEGAHLLAVPAAGTEQYPQGLGSTAPELAPYLATIPAKLAFSAGECGAIFSTWRDQGRWKIVVCGIETHVCVAQTVLDLLAEGFRVFVPVDAVGARYAVDHDTALGRLEASGATLTTTEAVLFEWCERAGTPEFKGISQLVRQSPPEE